MKFKMVVWPLQFACKPLESAIQDFQHSVYHALPQIAQLDSTRAMTRKETSLC